MVYYLTGDKKIYFETENYTNYETGSFDVHPNVYCVNYVNKILSLKDSNQDYSKWMKWLAFLDEFRGWFWEDWVNHNCTKNIIDDTSKAQKAILEKLQEVADDLGLSIGMD